MTTRAAANPATKLLRNLQALLGICGLTAALWGVDWRLGLGAFSCLSILTSRFWRAA